MPYTQTQTQTHTHTYACKHTCARKHTHSCKHTHMQTHTCKNTHTHANTHTRMQTHTHACKHTHTYMSFQIGTWQQSWRESSKSFFYHWQINLTIAKEKELHNKHHRFLHNFSYKGYTSNSHMVPRTSLPGHLSTTIDGHGTRNTTNWYLIILIGKNYNIQNLKYDIDM